MEKAARMGAEARPLSDEQKKRIAVERSRAEARIAGLKISLDQKIAAAPAGGAFDREVDEAGKAFLAEKEKIEASLETKIGKIRDSG